MKLLRKNDTSWIEKEYDQNAGWYVSKGTYEPITKYYNDYGEELAKNIVFYAGKPKSILEAGEGEGSTLSSLLGKLDPIPDLVAAFDISWSKVAYARKLCSKYNVDHFVGNLESIALPDNSIEVVYTSHAVEPNRGKEKKIVKELYRVASKYIILFEPIYELGDRAMRKRMRKMNYVRGLRRICKKLGYDIVKYEKSPVFLTETNHTGIIVIKKDSDTRKFFYTCPQEQSKLKSTEGHFYSEEAGGVYPVIDGIPCLKESNFIVANKFGKKIRIPGS
jgi:SAM-dependent methyltransferase